MGNVNKVTAETETTTTAVVEKGRTDFDIKSALYKDKDGNVVTAVNADGLLIVVPLPIRDGDKIVYAGYDTRKYNPLTKTSFASLSTFMRHQAFVAKVRAAILIKGAEEKERKADNIEKFGDESTRKKVAKLTRMRDALKALENQLGEEGVDTTSV